MTDFLAVCDGGCNKELGGYFSYVVIDENEDIVISMDRWQLSNLDPDKLPRIVDKLYLPSNIESVQKETNSVAELAALYYLLMRFRETYLGIFNTHQLTIFSDSQLVQLDKVMRASHLIPWQKAIQHILWDKVTVQWIPNEDVKCILGH